MTDKEMLTAINYLVKTGASFEDLVSLCLDYRDRFGSWVSVPTLLVESDAPEFYCVVNKTDSSRCYVSAELGAKSWRDCYEWMIRKCKTPADRELYEIGYLEAPEVDENELSFITSDMFAAKLGEICYDQNLLNIPGVYEIVSEYFNNEVIEALRDERARA